MASWGFLPGDFETDPVEVWPEHVQALHLFQRLQTQWRIGMSGPVGLNYPSVYPLIDRATKTGEEWDLLFWEVQQIEFAALAEMHDKDD